MNAQHFFLALMIPCLTINGAFWNCRRQKSCQKTDEGNKANMPSESRPSATKSQRDKQGKSRQEITRERLQRLHELRHASKKTAKPFDTSAWITTHLMPSMRTFDIDIKLTPKDKNYYNVIIQETQNIRDQINELTETIHSAYSTDDAKNNISYQTVMTYLFSDDFKKSDNGKKIITYLKKTQDFLVTKLADLEKQPAPTGSKITEAEKEKFNKKRSERVLVIKAALTELAAFSQNYFNFTLTTTETTPAQRYLTRKEERKLWQKEQRKKKKQTQQQTPPPQSQQPQKNQQQQQMTPPPLPASVSPQLQQELINILQSTGQNPTQQEIQKYQQDIAQFMQKLNPQQQKDIEAWFQNLAQLQQQKQ